MRTFISMMILPIFLCFSSGTAWAEMAEGKVAHVDPAGGMIFLVRTNAEGVKQMARIAVRPDTVYSGTAKQLADVTPESMAKVDLEKDEATGAWIAKSVEIS